MHSSENTPLKMAIIRFGFDRRAGEFPADLASSVDTIMTHAGMSPELPGDDANMYERRYSSENNGGVIVKISKEGKLRAWFKTEDGLKSENHDAYVEYIGIPRAIRDATSAQIKARGQPQQAQPKNGTYRSNTNGGKR